MKTTAYSYRDDPAVPDFDDDHPLVVFDGDCGFCARDIRFLLRHDRKARYRFTSCQSELGTALLSHFGHRTDDYDTSLLVEAGRAYAKSDGVIRSVAGLGGAWRLVSALLLFPRPLRDALYDVVARNRMRIAGRTNACDVPAPEHRARFL